MGGRRALLVGIVLGALVAAPAAAQSPGKPARIGVVLGGTLVSRQSQLDAFRQGMRDLGYAEGRNVVFEVRAPARDDDAPFAAFAADVVRLKVDVLVVQATGPILAAKLATSNHPHRHGPRVRADRVIE